MPQPPPTFRDSIYSTDSTTTYASTLSSLTSSLGLTESPLPPAKKTMAMLETVRDQSESLRRQAMLQGKASRGDVRASGGAVTQRVQSFENIRKEVGAMATSPGRAGGARPDDRRRKEAITQRPSSSQLRTRQSSPHISQHQQPPPQIQVTKTPSMAPTPINASKSQIAIPVRRPPHTQPQPPLRPPPVTQALSSPTRTDDGMAEDWDAELRRGAQISNLHLRPEPSVAVVTRQQSREAVAVKPVRDEWELAAMRIDVRETGRDAEERVRRDPTREIAYPPSMPQMAIRAAPTGVTSIHVGVRPRIHPTRTEESLSRNQPDINLAEPLFSPNSSAHPLASPGSEASGLGRDEEGTVRGSYNNKYKGELAEKAKREYEDWVAKKAEREGGRDEEGNARGAQEWEPRERTQARFGELNQPMSSHPDPNLAAAKLGMGMLPGEGVYGYGHNLGQGEVGANGHGMTDHPLQYQQQQMQAGFVNHGKGYQAGGGEGGLQQGYAGYDQGGYPYDPQQGYWDPMAYWWAMTQMQMQMQGMSMEDIQAYGMNMGMGMGMQGDGVSPITSEESSQGSSDDGVPPKIHFAPSPKKDKGRLKHQPSEAELYQHHLQQQQLYLQQYGDAYDPDMKKMVHWGMTPPHQHSELPGGDIGLAGMGAYGGRGLTGMRGQGGGIRGMGMGAYPQPAGFGGVGFGLSGGAGYGMSQNQGQGQMGQMSMLGMPMGSGRPGFGGGMSMQPGMGQGFGGGMGIGAGMMPGHGMMSGPGMSGMQGMQGFGGMMSGQCGQGQGYGGMNHMGAGGFGMGMNPGMSGGGIMSGLVLLSSFPRSPSKFEIPASETFRPGLYPFSLRLRLWRCIRRDHWGLCGVSGA